jgi:hypothetical protein
MERGFCWSIGDGAFGRMRALIFSLVLAAVAAAAQPALDIRLRTFMSWFVENGGAFNGTHKSQHAMLCVSKVEWLSVG